MVLSSLGNISGWSSILTCSDIHHASKSSPGFPYNHLGDRILSGLAGAGRGEAGGAGIAAAGGGEAGGAGIAAAGGGAAGAGGGAAGGNGNAGDPPPPGDPPASEQVGAGGRETSRWQRRNKELEFALLAAPSLPVPPLKSALQETSLSVSLRIDIDNG